MVCACWSVYKSGVFCPAVIATWHDCVFLSFTIVSAAPTTAAAAVAAAAAVGGGGGGGDGDGVIIPIIAR